MIADSIRQRLTGSSEIRKMFEEGLRLKEERGAENVFDFSIGNPALPTPAAVEASLVRWAQNGHDHGYMPNAGFSETRQKVAALESRRNGVSFSESGVVMTCGAAAALNISLASILDPGDEVIVLSPFFAEYLNYIRNYQGQPILVSCQSSGQLDLAAIGRSLSVRTKALILNSPNNPSGAVYPREDLAELSEMLTEHREAVGQTVYIVSDEPYRELLYRSEPVPGIAGIYPHSLICYSWSKSFSVPGERIGYVAVPDACEDYDALLQALVLCNRVQGFVNAPAIWQRVVTDVMDIPVDVSPYQKKRDALVENLRLAGFRLTEVPEGAFYLFPELPEHTPEAGARALEILKEEGILAVNGTGFGAPGFLRFAYCTSDDVIERSRPAFERAREAFVKEWPAWGQN